MKESRFLEFKSDIANSFLKTVSAYSNIGTGLIKFGYNDDGTVCGLNGDLKQLCLDLENRINDSITPKPDFRVECNYSNQTIDLLVYEGVFKPYMYKAKAYKRNDTSTVEMDTLEVRRAILEGKNLSFEQLDVDGDLTFHVLEEKLKEVLGITLNRDILKTLGLINDDGKYNHVALILSDHNPLAGVDVVRFGEDINEIMDRETIQNESVLAQYEKASAMYRKYYECEVIDGPSRKIKYIVPKNAFREALANALIHRTWDDSPNVRISMFQDRIEIVSPGGLMHGISKEEFLNGQVSKLRNPLLANVFFRLRWIEMFGTGILRIQQLYQDADFKPEFQLFENSLKVVLPSTNFKPAVTMDENRVVDCLKNGIRASSNDLVVTTGFSKDKILRLIHSLRQKGYIKQSGAGKGTRYFL